MDDEEPNQRMLVSDMILAWDPSFRTHLKVYPNDETKLKRRALDEPLQKLTKLGCGLKKKYNRRQTKRYL